MLDFADSSASAVQLGTLVVTDVVGVTNLPHAPAESLCAISVKRKAI